ncbi:Taurine catabolism dioxygenase TauD/TfdA [Penicillium daleae]|uniref:Taurine catabolism dioxygenase TauD/TfdA n=1 Tax=Penicillium daleae TaxID=63821 RepID=A0AAD6G587_9EURO|nr:Taurine catabolism dioxygenase TauD/TfdA [Penicillium daleae]KAJ5456010.1 Taurine catabolism dioxygenase TauD/TfdA [Penicillium daleae]
MSIGTGPQAWKTEDVKRDNSWILRLTPEEVEGFRIALVYAKAHPKELLDMTQADYPLPEASKKALERAIATTQDRWGICLVKGFPVDEWSETDMRVAYWGMGLYMGVGRTQNRASEVINDVRDAGGSYKVKGGRGYNTNAGLDFHQDSADVVALLCRRTAKSGGTSKVMSSIALRDRVAELRPDLLPVLESNTWFHSYQNTQDPSQPPYYRCPLMGQSGAYFCGRTNRKNTVAAQRDFPEVPRLTGEQEEALDLLDTIMPADEYCYSMELERGDMQLLNSFVTLHSRTPFEDYEEPDEKRHLMRLWLSIPSSQPLPPQWAEYWGDARAGAVRGGVRGSAITEDFLKYERRQAEAMGMSFTSFKPVVTKEEMSKIVVVN